MDLKSTKSTSITVDQITTETKATATVVIRKGKKVLLVKEALGSRAGKWNLPGGVIENSESILEAAVREAQEETGFNVKPTKMLGIYYYTSRRNRPRVRFVILGEVISGEISTQCKEIDEVRWFSLKQLLAMPNKKLKNPPVLQQIFQDLDQPNEQMIDNLSEQYALLAS